jgi:hypothetical protein
MKKLALLAVAMASCLTSYGQGYFIFSDSATTAVWDVNSSGVGAKSPADILVALMVSTDTSVSPLFGTSGTPTNATAAVSWSQITADPNFHVAMTNGVMVTAPTRTGISLGTFNGGTIGIDNGQGLAPGETVKMYAVAWNLSGGIAGFGNQADTFLGWSNPFLITLGSSSSPGPTLNVAGMFGFGAQAVPEPTSFALVGLSSAALLIFRRRK